ncbi:hypothetical protein ACFQYP_18890 [Nonomuraea antimicrobica]
MKKARTFYVASEAIGDVEAYVDSSRAWAVRHAQRQGLYEQLPEMRLVTKVTRGLNPAIHWVDRDGVAGKDLLSRLPIAERALLFTEGPHGPEPLWLRLNEQGLPFHPHSWNGVFRTANQRCNGGENTTEPLAAETMGPLLVWAMRMVDDFADDILAAWAETQRLKAAACSNPSTPAGKAALHAYLDPLINGMAPLPATPNQGRVALARHYVGGKAGASESQIRTFSEQNDLKAAVGGRPGPCPLNILVTGWIAGGPWREVLDFNEAAGLMRHLGTAAFVVCAYLTGMSPGEVLGLRTGCCPDPKHDEHGNVGRHLIRGRDYKNSVDEHGNHRSAGTEREVPWVAITPVVNAVRVPERMVPEGCLLFDHDAHDLRKSRPGTGSLKPISLGTRIEAFIAWANAEATTHGLSDQFVPPDPHGPVGTQRFRRSLAWHIARRPNGLVALAIQYGHLRSTFVSDGYASRSRGGIHELIDVETVRAVADTVADLRDGLQAGRASRACGPAGHQGRRQRHGLRWSDHHRAHRPAPDRQRRRHDL